VGITLGAMGAAILIVTVAFVPTIDRLSCQKNKPYYALCDLESSSLLGLRLRRFAIDPLKGSQIYPEDIFRGYNTRVMLYAGKPGDPLTTHNIPLSRYQTSKYQALQTSLEINSFLDNPNQSSIRIFQSAPLPIFLSVILTSIMFFAIGLTVTWLYPFS
jgi:hypothetical protein